MVELLNISHDNIIAYLVSFTEGSTAYFGFELMQGGSLLNILKTRFPLGIKEVGILAAIMKSVLTGMDYLH